MIVPYSQMELVHANSVDRRFRNPCDWANLDYGYPSFGEYCIVAYMAGKNNATHYCIAEYTEKGFKEWNTDFLIPTYDLLGWKRTDLPY